MPRNLLIQVRRDTADNWLSSNPVLATGEFGHETNTGKMKIGDGTRPWSQLPYVADVMSDNVVTNSVIRDSAGLSVIGRAQNTSGDPADIVASQDHQVLRRSGNTLSFGQIGSGSILDGAITSAKIANETIVDEDVSTVANIQPSKLGPGPLPGHVKVSTPSYIIQSVTQSKLSDNVDETGVGVWRNYTPVLSTENGAPAGTYDVIYAKFMKINNLMMVNVLLKFTNATPFVNVIYCSLPLQPMTSNLTSIGSAYHLNADARPNMPPINPVVYNSKVAFIDHRGQYYYNPTTTTIGWYGQQIVTGVDPNYWWYDIYPAPEDDNKKGFYLGEFKAPDRLSFDVCYEVA